MKTNFIRNATCMWLILLFCLTSVSTQAEDILAPDSTTQGAAQSDGFSDLYADHAAVWRNWVFVSAPRARSDRGNQDGGI